MWIDDDILVRCADSLAMSIWIPEQAVVVLGSSNQPDIEAELDACAKDGVPVLKRYGGGGTVLLYEGCAIVSLGVWVKQHYQNKLYFDRLNQAVIDALGLKWPKLNALGQRGLSDITYGDLKVAGTSLFRSRNYLLYQASLLVDLRPELMSQYLKHPSREPDYRAGRSHKDFLIGLSSIEQGLTSEQCSEQLTTFLPHSVRKTLGDELVAPIPDQFAALAARVERSALESTAAIRVR